MKPSMEACVNGSADPESSACRYAFTSTCVNSPAGFQPLPYYANVWTVDGNCAKLAALNSKTGAFNSDWIQGQMFTLFNKIYGDDPIYATGSQPDIQDRLYEVCSANPIACRTALLNKCSRYTANEVSQLAGVSRFCGCYLPSSEYERQRTLFGISRECSPVCSGKDNISYVTGVNKQQVCEDSLCIISDITLNLNNTTTGDITFEQACGGCLEGVCSCSITNVSLDAVNAEISSLNLAQNCKGGAVECYGQDPNNPSGPAILVDCATQEPTTTSTTSNTQRSVLLWLISVAIVLIVLIFIVSAVVSRKLAKARSTGKTSTVNAVNRGEDFW